MTVNESIKKINSKTHIFFFVCLIIFIIILISISFYQFSKYGFYPKYTEDTSFISDKLIGSRYHLFYIKSFILYNTSKLFLNNLFFISLLFNSLLYSLIINRGDLVTTDGKKTLFAKIVTHGLYILILLTFVYYIAIDFLIPKIEQKMKTMRENTLESMVLLDYGNKMYHKKDYKNAYYFYDKYNNIIQKDRTVIDRLREINNKIKAEDFDKNLKEKKLDTSIPDIKKDYLDLANIYFDRKDYYTAWYYYIYIAETDSAKKAEAIKRINEIKTILRYQYSMKTENEKADIINIAKFMDQKEHEIYNIYKLKKQANDLNKNGQYHEAYFIYNDILNINPNLRDVIIERDKVYEKLIEKSVELSDINKIKIYPKKNNIVIMIDKNKLLKIKHIIKTIGEYYLYDIKIYEFTDNFDIKNVITAPYGKSIGPNNITLYCFSKDDQKLQYKPQIFNINSQITIEYPSYTILLPIGIDTFYDMSYDYKKTFDLSLYRLFELINLNTKKLEKLDNTDDNKVKLINIKDFYIGLNTDFIKTAIVDKISHIFLFFYVNLIFISLAWRLKSYYIGNIPILHILLMAIIPVFIYIFVIFLNIFVTSFYSILTIAITFSLMLIICFVINIIIMFISIFFLASCK